MLDLRNKCPPVYNQLNLGSCTANALAFAYQFDEKTDDFTPSRLFIYYNERKLENTIDSDSGASLRDGIKTINKIGVCNEDNWIYDPNNFTDKPPENCYNEAKLHRSVRYHKIKQELNQFKGCIKSGYPFVFGFSVYQSFESDEVASTGIMPLPAKDEKLAAVLRDDMAEAYAKILSGTNHDNKVYNFSNSEAVSFKQIATYLSEISGKEIGYVSPDVEEYQKTLSEAGVPEEAIGITVGFSLAIAEKELNETSSDLENILGRKPVSLKDFLTPVYQ